PKGVLTIMFTDIVGSTAMADFLKTKHGDDRGADIYTETVREPHDKIIRECLKTHNGHEVKTIGDSFMAVFERPHDAVRAAAGIIKELKIAPIENPEEKNNPLEVRIGFHMGIAHPDIVDGKVKDYTGHHVNLAARVEAIAKDSQVLFSGVVKEIVGSLPDFQFYHWGKRKLKGIKEHIEIYELKWEGKTLGPEPPHDKSFNYPPVYDLKDVIGRDGFINDLKENIKKNKLVTICGTGGVGKTAVAIKTSTEIDDEYDLFFINMDRLNDDADDLQIVGLIAASAELPKESGRSLDELTKAIRGKCQNKPVLLLIDNYESIDDAKGRRVIAGLVGVEGLKILITSRRAAGVANYEKVIELEPFELKAGNRKNAELVKFLKSSDSYKLLEARVRLLGGMNEWEVPEVNAEYVKEILEITCGLPLAIELVAGWMNYYSWKNAAASLKESFDELMKIEEGICEGQLCKKSHLSVKACFNWSYDRLSEPAQKLFRALSLFANGFEASLVEACYGTLFKKNGKTKTLPLLIEIQRSSLISCTNGKWSFLPIVHRYGKDLLNGDEGKPEIEAAFISYWDNFVKEYSTDDVKLKNNLKLFEQEHGHLIEFLNLLLANEDNHDRYIINTGNLSRFWLIERMWGDSIKYLESAMEIAKKKAAKDPDNYQQHVAGICNNLANLLANMGDLKEAKVLFEEALRLYKTLAEKHPDAYLHDVAGTSNNLAILLKNMGDLDGAKVLFEEALQIRRTLVKKHPDAYLHDVALTCNNFAALLSDMGDRDRAKIIFEQALRIRRTLAEKHPDAYLPDVAITSYNLAKLLKNMGDLDTAKGLYEEALQIIRSLAEKHPEAYSYDVAETSNNLANLLANMGDLKEAKILYEEALQIRRTLVKKHPAVYLKKLADVCHNYAIWLKKMVDLDGAKTYFDEEADIRNRLKGTPNKI
ncbi:MAG: tetratricopeptide repeat protein, partial [Nitrospirae bacterium]|nr:tetratricopeptide repeat protein [Nitrospirota bacterium]